jgi:hypothetical protein
MSSPPLTTSRSVPETSGSLPSNQYSQPTAAQISGASFSELQSLVYASVGQIQKLSADLQDTRTTASHYRLQHDFLRIESQEAANRQEVEHEMTRREVEQIRRQQDRQRNPDSTFNSPGSLRSWRDGQVANEITRHCKLLEDDAALSRRRLRKAKIAIEERDDELASLRDENQQLRKRIRDNRDHMMQVLSPGGIYENANSPRVGVFPVTPQRRIQKQTGNSTGRSSIGRTPGSQRARGEDSFAALLLADQVLSQETPSLVSTPSRRQNPQPRTPKGQIMSSHLTMHRQHHVPTPGTNRSLLLSPVNFPGELRARETIRERSPHRSLDRRSRGSTISASDNGSDNDTLDEEDDDEIPESQASRAAASMLRQSPERHIEVIGTPSNASTPHSGNMVQSRLFGHLTKPGLERQLPNTTMKRKGGDETENEDEHPSKRAMAREGVGLGIGAWNGH